MTATVAFEKSLRTAMTRRAVLIDRLATDHTDCYRLFHGTQEGVPGVTLDRYGDPGPAAEFPRPRWRR